MRSVLEGGEGWIRGGRSERSMDRDTLRVLVELLDERDNEGGVAMVEKGAL